MSFLKKLFKSEKNTKVPLEILYPILKPGDWPGLPHAVWNKIIGTNENPELVIAYGYDAGDNLTFLTNQKNGDRSALDVHNEAITNLKKLPDNISDGTAYFDGAIWTASGNDFSAEKILDKEFLKAAHEKAKSDLLWFSIPRRRCLKFCKAGLSEEFQKLFIQLHLHAWQEDTYHNAPIVNMLFEVRNGEIENAMDMNPYM